MTEAAQSLLALSAREGYLVDEAELDVVADEESGVIATALPGAVVDKLQITTLDGVDAEEALAVGMVLSPDPEAEINNAAAAVGAGFGGSPSRKGYQLFSNEAVQITRSIDPDILDTSTPNEPIDYAMYRYWKYVLPEGSESAAFAPPYRSGSDFWIYAVQGVGDAKNFDGYISDLTVRARPHSSYVSLFRNEIAKEPIEGARTCDNGGNLGITAAGYGINFPGSSHCRV